MAIARHRQAECLEQQDLPRRVGEVVVAAQHERHAHRRVVQRVAEEERDAAIRAADHEVADVVAREALRAVDQVVELDEAPGRHAEPQRRAGSASTRRATSAAGSDAQVPA